MQPARHGQYAILSLAGSQDLCQTITTHLTVLGFISYIPCLRVAPAESEAESVEVRGTDFT